jgi:hypothetical protein
MPWTSFQSFRVFLPVEASEGVGLAQEGGRGVPRQVRWQLRHYDIPCIFRESVSLTDERRGGLLQGIDHQAELAGKKPESRNK